MNDEPAAGLSGLWRMPSDFFPGAYDYSHFDDIRGRLVSFVIVRRGILQWKPMHVWFRLHGPNTVVASVARRMPWQAYEYRREEKSLTWVLAETLQVWERVPPGERPDWLDARLAESYTLMDARETSGEAPVWEGRFEERR